MKVKPVDADVDIDVSVRTTITILLTLHPRLSVNALQSKLKSIGLSPSRILITSVRSSVLWHLDVLDDAGLI